MADVVEYTDFWVGCAAAGPVLLIPTYLIVRQDRNQGSTVRSGVSLISVLLLAAGTVYALVMLADGTPVHGSRTGRLIELVLICVPVFTLATSQIRHSKSPGGNAPRYGQSGKPEID